jgi:hypothetical protein
MDLSIIIVSYNTKELTLSCIESIYESKPKIDLEVIVVDNGSNDGSVEALEELKGIRLIKNKKNLGFSRANNQAIKKARGKHILLLNSDTIVKEGAVDKLCWFAEKRQGVGVVAPRLLNPDGSVQASVFRFPTIKRAIRQYWLGKKGLLDKYAPKANKPIKVEVAVMAAFLITPEALKRVGLLNEKYFMYFEDLDYCRRLKKAGLKVYYLPAAQIVHLHGASGGHMKQLVLSSKVYHGNLRHYLVNFIIWSGQKWQKLKKQN